MNKDGTLPLEHFIQAVQSQLDNAQTAMAVKARNLNLSLTFAIKDIAMDLHAHVEFAQSEIRIRPAGPGEKDTSVFHLVFTAITRPMIEENAVTFAEEADDESIDELKDTLTDDERKRLEWVGVRTISKLREIDQRGAARTVGRAASLPVDRLRNALQRASSATAQHVLPVMPGRDDPADMPTLLRVQGRNLTRAGLPRVSIAGEPVSIVKASDRELLLAPMAHQMAGEITIEHDDAPASVTSFDLRPFWRGERTAAVAPSGEASNDGGAK
jgi:hypothetical protein